MHLHRPDPARLGWGRHLPIAVKVLAAVGVTALVAVLVASALAIRGASMLYVVLVGGLVYVAVQLASSAVG